MCDECSVKCSLIFDTKKIFGMLVLCFVRTTFPQISKWKSERLPYQGRRIICGQGHLAEYNGPSTDLLTDLDKRPVSGSKAFTSQLICRCYASVRLSWPVCLYIHTYVIHDRRPLSAHGQCTVRAQSSYFLSTHILGSRWQMVNFALTLSLLRYAFLDLSVGLILVFQHVFSSDFSMRVSKIVGLTGFLNFNLKNF